MPITSAQNPKIKHLAQLAAGAKYRRESRQTVLEGTHLLAAYLDAGFLPEHVYTPESSIRQPEIRRLLDRLPDDAYTFTADGILARVGSLDNADGIITLIRLPETAAEPEHAGDAVLLDAVQDAGNAGTVLRSAAAAGVQTAVFGRGCADAWSPKTLRAGMGAHFLLNIVERADLAQWLARYPHRTCATTLNGNPVPLYGIDLRQPCAWLFGNEGSGVSPELAAAADMCVRIPMPGGMESLNIAQAATVCLFEQVRQRLAETFAKPQI